MMVYEVVIILGKEEFVYGRKGELGWVGIYGKRGLDWVGIWVNI